MNTPIRTRFAPSPTGFQHVGNIRTALFAYLVARQAGGDFILRLEDTDKKREVEAAADHLVKTLRILGLDWDEGYEKGGPYAPYKQSERLPLYHRWAQQLIDRGRAYADPYSPQEIQSFREQAQHEKRAFLYRNHRPINPPEWDGTMPLRFKCDPKSYSWHDEVMGDLSTGPEVIDDFVLIKSDGYPTYNFCHIVDDAEMKITHIIRGQEFISSQPNYLNLYEALDLTHPVFATMPHILAVTGGKKLGKRDGAKDILDYIHDGFLPEALLSFIATLGWNDGTEQEVFSKQELIKKFSLSRVQRSGARFDEKRLLWMNGQFIRDLSVQKLYEKVENFWPDSTKEADEEYKRQVLRLAQDRLKTLNDLKSFGYFFNEPQHDKNLVATHKQLKKIPHDEINLLLQQSKETLEKMTDWTPESIQHSLNQLLETTNQKPGVLFSLIRIYLTWAPFSPQLNDTMALLGKETCLRRLSTI
jgi:glutamyl-tRNA synthetase